MPGPVKPAISQPFTRYQHPDPKTNQMFQDLYDKLQQIQDLVVKLLNKVGP